MLIGLLECDHVAERFLPIRGDYREMFVLWLERNQPGIDLRFYDVCTGQYPFSIEECDAWMTTGSCASAYEAQPWIDWLKGFVRKLHAEKKAFVGICFGHQILAEALGGKVEKSEAGWGVGVHPIDVLQSEPWMMPAKAQVALHFMHQDQVVRLPERAIVFGKANHCPVAAFRIDSHMLGIQAHPEFTLPYCEALIRDRIGRIGATTAEAALEHIAYPSDEDIIAAWVGNFLRQSLK